MCFSDQTLMNVQHLPTTVGLTARTWLDHSCVTVLRAINKWVHLMTAETWTSVSYNQTYASMDAVSTCRAVFVVTASRGLSPVMITSNASVNLLNTIHKCNFNFPFINYHVIFVRLLRSIFRPSLIIMLIIYWFL